MHTMVKKISLEFNLLVEVRLIKIPMKEIKSIQKLLINFKNFLLMFKIKLLLQM